MFGSWHILSQWLGFEIKLDTNYKKKKSLVFLNWLGERWMNECEDEWIEGQNLWNDISYTEDQAIF